MKVEAKYQVEELDDKHIAKQTVYTKTETGLEHKVVEQKGGYMVYYPQGHSIRVESKAQLERLGYDMEGGLVDMESGEDVPLDGDGQIDYRTIVARNTQYRRRQFANQ